MSHDRLTQITDKVIIKLNPIGPCSGLSNELLCILVAQGDAKLPEAKVKGLKKMKNIAKHMKKEQTTILFGPPALHFCSPFCHKDA